MSLTLLSAAEVKESITMNEAINAMERAFIQLAEKKAVMPVRTGVPGAKDGLTLTMPGYLAGEEILGLKVVSIFPQNILMNKAAIQGVVLLLNAETGEPAVLMDAQYLTALRTGAISGLATRYFAVDDARKVAIIGSGVQAQTQLEAVAAVRDIRHVSIWSRQRENAQLLAKKFADRFHCEVCRDIPHAVKDADGICTATSSTEPLITAKHLSEHVHINAIGSHTPAMSEISSEVLSSAHIVVDQIDAVMAEAGEIIQAVNQGAIKQTQLLELGTWLMTKNPDLRGKRTVFKSVGLAIQDLSVAQVVYSNAQRQGMGTSFQLS